MSDSADAIEILSESEEHTLAVAEALASALRPGDCLLLRGELGAGKTRFVKGLARGLGIDPAHVSSPTFVIMQEYTRSAGLPALIHIDAYRLTGPDDLDSIAWDPAAPGDDIAAIEWPERLGDRAPARAIDIEITPLGEFERRITVAAPAERRAEFAQALARPEPDLTCPTCGAAVAHDAARAPFCSERCRMADLSRWFSGRYSISRPLDQRDIEETE